MYRSGDGDTPRSDSPVIFVISDQAKRSTRTHPTRTPSARTPLSRLVNQSLLFQRGKELSCRDYRFYTCGLFQTTDRRKAKSKMGEEEANQDLTGKRKKKEESSEVSSDSSHRVSIPRRLFL